MYSLQDVFDKKWVRSKTAKDGVDETIAKYDGEWVLEASAKNALVGDLGLVMKSKAKHAAIATRLKKPFVFEDKVFIVQYELNFQVSSESIAHILSHSVDGTFRRSVDRIPLEEIEVLFYDLRCIKSLHMYGYWTYYHLNSELLVLYSRHCLNNGSKNKLFRTM